MILFSIFLYVPFMWRNSNEPLSQEKEKQSMQIQKAWWIRGIIKTFH